MRYISTRGQSEPRDFSGVLLAGLGEDGGLFMPEAWPERSAAEWRALRNLPYAELAAIVIHPFVGDALRFETLRGLCERAYAGFDHPARVPLVQLDDGLWVQELFHGPTLAFKDMALQLLGLLFEHVLAERDETMTIVGATSGDTGSAAIEACRDRARIKIAILHPEGRTSEVQRRQMTTVHAANVYNIAVAGTFDDCQDMVKGFFADTAFRREMRLSAVNSINWARIAAQIPYYVGLGPRPRRARPRGRLRRADRQFRQCAGGLGGAADGPAGGAPRHRLEPQRHPHPLPRRQRHDGAHGRTQPLAEHGHPGQLEFRAAAVRAAGPRRARDRRA